jgi:hypothetical protein
MVFQKVQLDYNGQIDPEGIHFIKGMGHERHMVLLVGFFD